MVPAAEKVLAGAVCILRGSEFDVGIYNSPTETIESWAKKK